MRAHARTQGTPPCMVTLQKELKLAASGGSVGRLHGVAHVAGIRAWQKCVFG